jgi:hypothetical protein
MKSLPIHKPTHPLESELRKSWEYYIECRPNFDLLSGPEVNWNDIPNGQQFDENPVTNAYQPYPYGRMTRRDHMIAAEIIQWLGTPLGFAFLANTFAKAGGSISFNDYSENKALLRTGAIIK